MTDSPAPADRDTAVDAPHAVRDRVTRRIAAQCRRFPDLDFSPPDTSGLSPRDAALASAIDHAVARRWITLATILQSRLDREWTAVEPKIKAPLLVGAAQVLLLDRVPDHAAINAAVEWCKRNGRPKAAGFVNAVLRRVADLRVECAEPTGAMAPDELPRSDGQVVRLAEPVFSDDPRERLVGQTSHPRFLIDRWLERYGDDGARRLALHGLVQAPIILSGTSTPPASCTAHAQPGFHVFDGAHVQLEALLEGTPALRVQDPTSAAPVAATTGLEPRLIVDVCAGRGTKTRQLAELHPAAMIVATDVDPGRRGLLEATFRGHDRVRVVDPGSLSEFAGQVDLLLLDVPCSNTGVLARRVEARYRLGAENLSSLVDLQRQIVADTLALLAPAGALLYSTCSIEPEENVQQADWIVRWHQMAVADRGERLPEGLPGEPYTSYADGGWFALLHR